MISWFLFSIAKIPPSHDDIRINNWTGEKHDFFCYIMAERHKLSSFLFSSQNEEKEFAREGGISGRRRSTFFYTYIYFKYVAPCSTNIFIKRPKIKSRRWEIIMAREYLSRVEIWGGDFDYYCCYCCRCWCSWSRRKSQGKCLIEERLDGGKYSIEADIKLERDETIRIYFTKDPPKYSAKKAKTTDTSSRGGRA